MSQGDQISDKEELLKQGKLATNMSESGGDYSQNSRKDSGIEEKDTIVPKKKLIRETGWRWLMLAFGCFFLMGSYFCFDNPAPLKNTLINDYGLSES